MNNQQPGIIKRVFNGLWRIINTTRVILLNLLFFGLLYAFFITLNNDDTKINVPENAALLLNLKGDIVEQKVEIDPLDAMLTETFNQKEERPEVLLANVVNVIDSAKNDDRISILVLKLDQLAGANLSKLQDIGVALLGFKEAGKKIIALGDQYSQSQYFMASFANEIWLDPQGFMLLDGFGSYQLYFKTALEKLSVSQHVFRVGTYKSAVEPYIRDNMSDEAKTANKLWLGDLWHQYKQDVARNRGFDINNFDETVEQLITKFTASNSNYAEYALTNGWVDSLKTRDQMRSELINLVGKNTNGKDFNYIDYKDYLNATTSPLKSIDLGNDKVAVVVAKGTILNGHQAPGTIGGDSTAQLLREARFDEKVKAVVLRVDSPGGSAYASEIIRQEVELIKQAGKPVVASMGSVAASGGYWISASADKILASPTTITGSIGIFGMFMTLENTLSEYGVHADGVGTTDFSGLSVVRPLSEGMSRLFQLSINRGYQDFITLVAENRNMTVEDVDKIAQGRVWSGSKAKELGLVDELGSLDDAITIAAELANLSDFDTKLIEKKPTARDLFLQNLFTNSAQLLGMEQLDATLKVKGPLSQMYQKTMNELKVLDQFNDPQGMYSFCLTCEIN